MLYLISIVYSHWILIHGKWFQRCSMSERHIVSVPTPRKNSIPVEHISPATHDAAMELLSDLMMLSHIIRWMDSKCYAKDMDFIFIELENFETTIPIANADECDRLPLPLSKGNNQIYFECKLWWFAMAISWLLCLIYSDPLFVATGSHWRWKGLARTTDNWPITFNVFRTFERTFVIRRNGN